MPLNILYFTTHCLPFFTLFCKWTQLIKYRTVHFIFFFHSEHSELPVLKDRQKYNFIPDLGFFFFFLNLCEGIILMKSVHSLGWHSLGWKLLHFPEKLYLMKKLGQTLPYFSISISLCWAREVHQDWKGVSCLGHSDPTVSLYLVMGCRSTPFITDFWDIICWWHITPELCLPILVVANHNSSKKSTSIYWLKEKFPSTWSVSVSSLWDLCTEKW